MMAHLADLPEFAHRHLGPSEADVASMLDGLGLASMDDLVEQVLPAAIRTDQPLQLPPALDEAMALSTLAEIADRNRPLESLIGQGYHRSILPAAIRRNLLEAPAWYTAYTPYQPEISQGRLEALLTFQTMVADLTGLDVANASLLDEGTAAAEAMAMARRVGRSAAAAFFVDVHCHPQTIAVLRTRAEPLGWRIVVGDPFTDLEPDEVFGAVFQYPGTFGDVRDLEAPVAAIRAAGAIAVVAADPLALTLLRPPGEFGADIAVGSMQRFGVPLGFGGPHAAYIACQDAHRRALPGRLVGVSVDAHGRPAYRLALQTREQHIRREKATSNICTAQVLLAVVAATYAVHHGPEGLIAIARRTHRLTVSLATALRAAGFAVEQDAFFDAFTVDVGDAQPEILARAVSQGLDLRPVPATDAHPARLGINLDETSTETTVGAVLRAFDCAPNTSPPRVGDALPAVLQRRTEFLQHPIFHLHRSETELMRYLRRLSDRDLALDRAMIPLGSCTMKLNAAAEMEPIGWRGFADLHPFAPDERWEGYRALVADMEDRLCMITGYDAASFQPNSGAQGEYAGLLAIRAHLAAIGEQQRDVCLIPASAHGTNPASAQMVGWRVVVVACDEQGDVDLADLAAKADRHAGRLAAVMVTYPSTHGVFEAGIRRIAEIVHDRGGQVYLDGANLNAMVGLARPGDLGADVSHFNLHKTFCVPHGGGGPGVGPIAVKAHLARHLPRDRGPGDRRTGGPVAAAPYGSAGILPISWMYMAMMGAGGLTAATKVALLNANHLARRLADHYPLLYARKDKWVAHECIVDLRPITAACGVTADDVAKRLMDFGFHPPTMSFPVPGTLMIEPTESESLREIDRFAEAMIAIRAEIRAIEHGHMELGGSPLRLAPHTLDDLASDSWDRSYARSTGAFPVGPTTDKYWPAVNRVDNAFGDRNLVCSCPPTADYALAAA